jgi:hypothetical protein
MLKLYGQDTDVPDSLNSDQWLRENGYNLTITTRNFQYLVGDTHRTIYWVQDNIVLIENACGYEIDVYLLSKEECLEKIKEAVNLIHATELTYRLQNNETTLLYNQEGSGNRSAQLWLYEHKMDHTSTITYESGFCNESMKLVLHDKSCLIVYRDCDGESIEQMSCENAAQTLTNCLMSVI